MSYGYSYDPNQEVWPFEKRSLLTETEQRFYKILKEAIPEYPIYIQVPLSQMMRVKYGYDRHNWNNRVNRMSVDFVVCDHHTHIIAAIELDDPSHDNEKRQADDAKKDKALGSANIKVIRYRVENMPNLSKIRLDVMNEQKAEAIINAVSESSVKVNEIRLTDEEIISFKSSAKPKTFELSFDKLILMGIGFVVLGFIFSSSSKPNSKYSEQQLMQIAQHLDNETNRLKEKEHELYLRELNLRVESERQQEKLDQARRIYTQSTSGISYQHNNANTQNVNITEGSDIRAKPSDCKTWINSNIIDPSEDKKKYIKENCS